MNILSTSTAHIGHKISDEDLINQYVTTSDEQHRNTLQKRYQTKVFAKCISMLSNEEWAKDAVQDIFIKVFLNINKFGSQSSFSTRLYSITYNYCIDILRKRTKTLQIINNIATTWEPREEPGEVCDAERLDQKVEKMRIALDKLNNGEKSTLLLKYQEAKSIKEIAWLLGESDSAIKMRIMRAKQKANMIAKWLQEEKLYL